MIEKLLALFIHAKTGAISGVFLLGASGALVSATTENGVTTITITQASPSPSASASPSASPSATASPAPSASASPSPTASPSASPSPSPSATPSASPSAAPAARACVDAVQTVNAAFQDRHTTLAKMRSGKSGHGDRAARAETAAVLTVKRADDILKAIRKAAVRSIHATCPSSHHDEDDDDEDEDEDEDRDDDEDRDEDDDRVPSGGLLFTGTPAQIATQATAAMDLVMQAMAAQSPVPTTSPDDDDDDDDDDDKDRKQKDKAKGKDQGKSKAKDRKRS